MIFFAIESRVDMRSIVHSFCVPHHEILQSIHEEAPLKRYGNEVDWTDVRTDFIAEDKKPKINKQISR